MKPASVITDRAKRYRANQETQGWPQVCMFCAATEDLQRDHIDGYEEHGERENILILCRSCNQKKSAVYLKAGIGERTDQYNPGIFSGLFGRETDVEKQKRWARERAEIAKARRAQDVAVKRAERERRQDEARRERAESRGAARQERERKRLEAVKAVSRYKGVTIYKRGDGVYFASLDPDSHFESVSDTKTVIDHFRNPAKGYPQYKVAVQVLRGEIPSSAATIRQAARVIRSTPVKQRMAYLAQAIEKTNPAYGGGVPTFAQYGWAVAQHCGGSNARHHCGDHDEGGAIIHATPPDVRREYADKIAALKSRRARSRDTERWD